MNSSQVFASLPSGTSHLGGAAFFVPVHRLALLGQSCRVPWPALPLALPIRTFTSADFLATLGYTCTSSIQTGLVAQQFDVARSMPFQLPCVWSVTLCAQAPTFTIMRLSTRMVSVCLPGARPVPRS